MCLQCSNKSILLPSCCAILWTRIAIKFEICKAVQNDYSCYLISSQFARVVKGVDLRSTAGNCAWVETPQLTSVKNCPSAYHVPLFWIANARIFRDTCIDTCILIHLWFLLSRIGNCKQIDSLMY